jgi:epoxyqueuosine reductase
MKKKALGKECIFLKIGLLKEYQLKERSSVVKSLASEMGFSFTGISRAERLDEEARKLEEWLNRGMHGKMGYMENYFEKRVDPSKLVPGAKSVVSLMYNYYTEKEQSDPEAPKISKYAYGKDYHRVVKDKLFSLVKQIEEALDVTIEGRCFVDSAPVLERDWAKRSGIGWTGKNTLLIHPKAGSYFFLAELIIDLPLAADQPMKDYCGTCRKCIDACPTDAIDDEGYLLDARKCISYLTIELKEAIPPTFKGQMENWMFGCDICQEVCPWNRFSERHEEEQFEPHEDLLDMKKEDWEELTEEVFRKVFKKSAVKRAKFEGLKRNIRFLVD